jgi:GrpB-like predicted nucleotidyltransferase (UPF0157 family)
VEDALDAWRRLREAGGRRVTIIDLYGLVAEPRGLAAHELPLEERLALSRAALPSQWPGFENTPGSERPPEPVELVDDDPRWPEQFERWRSVISSALGEHAMRIEHVGSTSVRGLPAKPIIDVQVSVADLGDETTYVGPLEAAGLQLRTRDDVRRFFRPFPDRPRDVHVHVCATGSDWERDHLLFRDYLRSHPDACAAYAETKRLAAERWHDDRLAYTDAKTDTILAIMAAAERWDSRPR